MGLSIREIGLALLIGFGVAILNFLLCYIIPIIHYALHSNILVWQYPPPPFGNYEWWQLFTTSFFNTDMSINISTWLMVYKPNDFFWLVIGLSGFVLAIGTLAGLIYSSWA